MTGKDVSRQFLKAALVRQIYNCCDKPNYISGALISNRDKIKLLDIKLNQIISNNFTKRVIKKLNNQNGYQIDFDNGSRFKIVLGFEGSRGHRYHDLLIDDELDNESKFCYGEAKAIPYRYDYPFGKDYDDTSPENTIQPNIIILKIK